MSLRQIVLVGAGEPLARRRGRAVQLGLEGPRARADGGRVHVRELKIGNFSGVFARAS